MEVLEKGRPRVSRGLDVGVLEVEEAPLKRPYTRSIAKGPTSWIVIETCGANLFKLPSSKAGEEQGRREGSQFYEILV